MAKQHARYSPSALDNLSRCIRFRYKPRDDDSADEGTMLHDAARRRSTAGLDEEQRNAVETAIGYTDSLTIDEGGPDQWIIMKEVKLVLGDLTHGHADFVALHKIKPIAHVADYKYTRLEGMHEMQVRTYAAALISMLRTPGGTTIYDEDGVMLLSIPEPRILETVTTHVVAPRLHAPYVMEYRADQLLQEVTDLVTALYARIDDPWAPETPEADLCALCARAAKCPSLNAVVKHVAPQIGLPVPSEFSPDKLVAPRDRAIAQILAGALEGWAEEIKKHNNAFVTAGGEIPGYRQQTRGTGLKVREGCLAQALEALRAAGITNEMLMEAMTLAPAKLAKHMASISTLQEAEAKEEVKRALGDLAVEGSCSFLTKVKRVTDGKLLEQVTQEGA